MASLTPLPPLRWNFFIFSISTQVKCEDNEKQQKTVFHFFLEQNKVISLMSTAILK